MIYPDEPQRVVIISSMAAMLDDFRDIVPGRRPQTLDVREWVRRCLAAQIALLIRLELEAGPAPVPTPAVGRGAIGNRPPPRCRSPPELVALAPYSYLVSRRVARETESRGMGPTGGSSERRLRCSLPDFARTATSGGHGRAREPD